MERQKHVLRVVMPVHNARAYVDEALRSVLDDLPEQAEVVVVDDGASDGSSEVVDRIASKDGRVVVLRHATAKGVSEAINAGIRYGSCPPFVAIAEHDDLVVPGRFATQLAALDEQPRLAAVSGEGQYVGPSGRVFGRVSVGPGNAKEMSAARRSLEPILIPHPAIMYRTEAILDAGLYDSAFDGAQDLEIINRLVFGFDWDVVSVPERHVLYRLHDSATSFATLSRQRSITRYVRYRNALQFEGLPFASFDEWSQRPHPDNGAARRWARHDRGALYYRRAGLAWLEHRRSAFVRYYALALLFHPRWVCVKTRVLIGRR